MNLTIYLLFEGDCRQAMEFYRTVFGGELTVTTVGASPMKDMFPASMQERDKFGIRWRFHAER